MTFSQVENWIFIHIKACEAYVVEFVQKGVSKCGLNWF